MRPACTTARPSPTTGDGPDGHDRTVDMLMRDRGGLSRLLREHRLLREAFECGPGASIRDRDGTLAVWNTSYERGTGEDAPLRETVLPSGAVLHAVAPPEDEDALDRAHDRTGSLAALDRDIRNPMNGIVGMASLLAESALTDRQRAYVDIILRSAESLIEIVDARLDPAKGGAERAAAAGATDAPAASHPRPREDRADDFDILVAEDNEINQCLIEEILRDGGNTFRIVAGGREALDAWRAHRPRLVLMDISMPGMGGEDAAKAIRAAEAEEGGPRTAIVAVTAHALRGDRQRFLDAGMDDHLAKPVTAASVTRAVRRYLSGRQDRGEAVRA